MRVLFIGGTGIISSASSQLALEAGIDLTLLNRGQSFRPVPAGTQILHGDIREATVADALAGHTFDQTLLPMRGGYTMVDRMRRGQAVIVHGDGTSLWVLTHHRDFAQGFLGLLGHPAAIGEAFHITSDEVLTWNEIYTMVGRAAGVEPQLVHVPSDFVAAIDADWGSSLLGDKAHSVIFDNSKIKRLVPAYRATIPFHRGVRDILAYYDADPARQVIDDDLNVRIDRILTAYGRAWSNG